MAQLGERVAGIEGILSQISERLSHIEIRLMDFERNKADKWEIRLWFLLIVLLMTVYQFLD
ncbi:TPA: hypothetical protein EYP12_04830 [Candidatus Bipolaricaulota bacterium]|nr:hypothetical protein [Candidatus Bipolaricaulota bacterium]